MMDATISASAELRRHYRDVRARLFAGRAPLAHEYSRLVAIRQQSHRPDVELPSVKLPMVRITEATKQRTRDYLDLRSQDAVDGAPEPDHWQDIIRQVCAKHEITKSELLSSRRSVHLVAARHEAMYRMSRETSMSLPRIGRRLGGKDHTTVIHGIRKHAAKLGAAAL